MANAPPYKVCKKCGTQLMPEVNYCPDCGSALFPVTKPGLATLINRLASRAPKGKPPYKWLRNLIVLLVAVYAAAVLWEVAIVAGSWF